MPVTLNDTVQLNAPRALDRKYLKSGITPYTSISDVNTSIPIAFRSPGLIVLIDIAGKITPHWYNAPTASECTDDKLVPTDSGSTSASSPTVVQIGPGVSSWIVAAGTLIEKLIFIEPTNISVSVGTTAGGTDKISPFDVTGGYGIYAIDLYFPTTTTLYFNGITVNTIIKIYKR